MIYNLFWLYFWISAIYMTSSTFVINLSVQIFFIQKLYVIKMKIVADIILACYMHFSYHD